MKVHFLEAHHCGIAQPWGEPGKRCGMGKSLHCSTAALETGRQRSNAFQILKELLQHRTLLRGWDKDTVRYSRLSPLPCTLSEKVTGGCLSSKQGRNQEKGKDVKLEIGDLVEERGAGWGQEGSSVTGTEDSLELGKVKRYKRVCNLFSAPCGQGDARRYFPPVEESTVKFCFQSGNSFPG